VKTCADGGVKVFATGRGPVAIFVDAYASAD
jgi:hypothetical protein